MNTSKLNILQLLDCCDTAVSRLPQGMHSTTVHAAGHNQMQDPNDIIQVSQHCSVAPKIELPAAAGSPAATAGPPAEAGAGPPGA